MGNKNTTNHQISEFEFITTKYQNYIGLFKKYIATLKKKIIVSLFRSDFVNVKISKLKRIFDEIIITLLLSELKIIIYVNIY